MTKQAIAELGAASALTLGFPIVGEPDTGLGAQLPGGITSND